MNKRKLKHNVIRHWFMWTNGDHRYGRTKGRMPMLGHKKCHETPEPVSPPNLRACHSKCMARKYRLVLGHSFLKFYFCYFCFISYFLTLSLFSVVCCQALLLDKLAKSICRVWPEVPLSVHAQWHMSFMLVADAWCAHLCMNGQVYMHWMYGCRDASACVH